MKSTFVTHFRTMLHKRFRYQIKDYVGMICEVLLPIVFIFLRLLLVTIKFLNEYPKIELSTDMYFKPSDVVMSSTQKLI